MKILFSINILRRVYVYINQWYDVSCDIDESLMAGLLGAVDIGKAVLNEIRSAVYRFIGDIANCSYRVEPAGWVSILAG